MRSRHRSVFPLVLVGLVLFGGVSAFWFGLRAFRAHAEEQALLSASDSSGEDTQLVDTAALPALAVLRMSGQDVGRATRVFADGSANIDILVTLPPLDPTVTEYHVWLLKDGLADIVDLGVLTPRADGTWAGNFVAGPSTGVENPFYYSTIVLSRELRDGDAAPSGDNVAKGIW